MESSESESTNELPFNLYPLPDDVLLYIFSMLSFKDLLNIRESCRKFYRLINNNRSRVSIKNSSKLIIESNKKWGRSTFGTRIDILKSDHINGINVKMFTKIDIENGTELSRCFDLFDFKSLSSLKIIDCDNVGIFKALKGCLKRVAQLNTVNIDRVGVDDLDDLQNLIQNLGDIKHLEIRHICSGNEEETCSDKKIYPSLKLSSISSLERLILTECEKTKILDNNLMVEIIKNNKNLKVLEISSTNDIFTKQLIDDFLKAQEITDESERCNHNEVTLLLRCTFGIDKSQTEVDRSSTLIVYDKNLIKSQIEDFGRQVCIFNFCEKCKQLHGWINIMLGNEDKYHTNDMGYY